MSEQKTPVVAVAGAAGFVGQTLLKELMPTHRVIGITRGAVTPPGDELPAEPGITWRQADLFSLIDAEKALQGADYAYYLVHSMMPSARLTQGRFQDMDLILADNFARAAAKNGVKQIIYLGGLIPEQTDLSMHLRSRLEVEQTLSAHGVPVTALRAGLIIGARGSTFQIMTRLIERLKIMIFPAWMMSLTHPIALPDIIRLLRYCLANEDTYNQSFDVGGPDVMTYRDMILKTAEIMGYQPHIYTFSPYPAWLASLLLSLVTSSPRALVTPLVESLKHNMVARDLRLQKKLNLPGLPFTEAVKQALTTKTGNTGMAPPKAEPGPEKVLSVRSVQRLPLPPGRDADWVALYYSNWLPNFFKTIVRVRVDYKGCYFYFRCMKRSLLDLSFSFDRSSKDRPLYYITGGLLARLGCLPHRGRLEFREVLENRYVLVAIHDYVPTLPWFIYSLVQAPLHAWVMFNYGRHLSRLPPNPSFKIKK